MPRSILTLAIALLFTAACGDADVDSAATADAAPATDAVAGADASIWFESPVDGDVVEGSTLRVLLSHAGVEVVPAGVPGQGKGHHHLFLNEDVTPSDAVIPANNPRIIHLGQGQEEHLLEGLEPGEYRLIGVLADGIHVPVDPPLADTVNITILPAAGGS